MNYHKEKLCPRRMTRCEHCCSTMEWKVQQDHYNTCPNYPVKCTYHCGETVARYKMADHVGHQGKCPNSLLDCKFKNIGCPFRGRRSDLVKHGKDDADSHCSLMASELVATKQELEETKSKLAMVVSYRSFFLPVNPPALFVHTWRIKDWSQKMLEAKAGVRMSTKSNPFYVPPGYHLYLRADTDHCHSSDLGVFLRRRL